MNADLGARLTEIDARIADAARSAGRDVASISRIVVTKFHPPELVKELYDLDVRDVGENRQQELSEKSSALAHLSGLRWHFVGQAQTNKARAIRSAATVMHSLDRMKLANALDSAAEPDSLPLDVLLQVNLTSDTGRGGVAPENLLALAEHAAAKVSLRVRGVMAVAPLEEQPARAFERLRGYADIVRSVVPDAEWISAGMSADFADAIAMGATHLRIGSAITGLRPQHG
ncbi:YggS family pyridoxal phosphate-dependent enzyme [Microbacterium sp. NPDC076911]|uniref:YggS family pyridoxal phosphate-dependent enzyme n=1 Tax=Microbacterium sp. NPDC076911 TaxID=3154958 RepID=UPI00341C86DF